MSESDRPAHEAGLIRGLTGHFGAPVEIFDFRYLYGGGSRILGRFTARVGRGAAAADHPLVFRLDPPSSFVESDRGIEFAALEVLQHSTVPVPRPLMLDKTGDLLGAPCFIMSEVASGAASGFFDIDPYGERRSDVGQQVFGALGALATVPVDDALIAALGSPGKNPAKAQLDHWENIINADETAPQPIVRAGIRALRKRMPADVEHLSIVHGDFRSGNFLIDETGRMVALLDWEFVHLGDPLEDIAWCADPLWGHSNPALVGGMLPLEQAINAWETARGWQVDRDRLEWWRLFSGVKGMAMWTSSSEEFLREGGGEPGMAFPDTACAPVQLRMIAETLARWEADQ